MASTRDPASWPMTEARLGASRRRTRPRRAPAPRQHVNMGLKLARVRSGFVPETRAKSAEFAGIRFSSLRRRQRRNILDLQVKNRLDDASSAACHADGREFEPFRRLVFLESPDTSPSAHAIGMAPPIRAARPLQRFALMCFPGQPALTFAPERSRARSGARVRPDAEAELLDRAAARTSTAGSVRRAERSHGSSLRWKP